VTSLGNDAGDDFGKYPLEDGGSTNLFLGDEFGKRKSDEYRKCFTPYLLRLIQAVFFWLMSHFSGDDFGNCEVPRVGNDRDAASILLGWFVL